jgi:hypothetical protein
MPGAKRRWQALEDFMRLLTWAGNALRTTPNGAPHRRRNILFRYQNIFGLVRASSAPAGSLGITHRKTNASFGSVLLIVQMASRGINFE